jgi:hypothetical protein
MMPGVGTHHADLTKHYTISVHSVNDYLSGSDSWGWRHEEGDEGGEGHGWHKQEDRGGQRRKKELTEKDKNALADGRASVSWLELELEGELDRAGAADLVEGVEAAAGTTGA